MADIVVTDRRRVTLAGSTTKAPKHPKPRIDYKSIKKKVEAVWRHVGTHLRRSLSEDRAQETYRTVLWGLALSVRQTHTAAITLIADERKPNTLPLQAAILVRSLLEALGNIMGLLARPKSLRWFLADGYRRAFELQEQMKSRWGSDRNWTQWFAQMDDLNLRLAKDARLGKQRTRRPSGKNIPDWPAPWHLTHARTVRGRTRPLPVLLRGNRARLFDEIYSFWYSSLSAVSHQRWAAVQQAVFAENPDAHWNPGAVESIVATEALLFYTCAMSELEVGLRMPASVDLRALWLDLCALDEEATRVLQIRYRRLLALPRW